MPKDPELLAHLEWLGYLQPVGLVVSPPGLLDGQAHVNRNVAAEQQRFLACVRELPVGKSEPAPVVTDFPAMARDVLGWQESDLVKPPDDLSVVLPNENETLRPTFAVREYQSPGADASGSPQWLMLVEILPVGTPLDDLVAKDERHWQASPQARFERLLREAHVPIGLLVNGTDIRLVYAPRGESSGHLTFPVRAMAEVAGRPIFAAFHMLLSGERLFSLPAKQRLPAILAGSRKYQNTVSTRLAGQVLASLYELLRGFQAADDQAKGELLRLVLADDPDQVYAGLLTVLLRMVFLLFAEDRGLMSADAVYVNHYSVTGLFERLRADVGRFPDTMDQRYGAWAQLLTLFRLVHDGAKHGGLALPARKGYLFDPDRYPFLEGRPPRSEREPGQKLRPPMVADGVVYRVLDNLLILDGERLSYRALDVQEIGSVYETIMGFRLEKAAGPSIAVKAAKAHGAPAAVNLAELLAQPVEQRGKWLKERTDLALTGAGLNGLKAAKKPEDVVAALDRKVAREATPNIVAAGSMVLQPSDERRRSGSHYTPRSLTEPIVRKTLEPILKRLGDKPTPQQILDLKVCDPAMGSAAFLVETCRQLGDALVTAWHAHGKTPAIPPDEDEILHARRMIAQRCLYGVDKNPMAVDLAKLSLWLATLARDHPFTFLDHALRCGDSLVGLTKDQIRRFHWQPGTQQMILGQEKLVERIEAATRVRQAIIEADDFVPYPFKKDKLADADGALNLVRLAGNLVIAAFFASDNDKQRKLKRDELLHEFTEYLNNGDMARRPSKAEKDLITGDKAIHPFHWEIEFPEVFGRENGGFDAMVGNPPFLGGWSISGSLGHSYLDYLTELNPESGGQADLISYFFRRSFEFIRQDGAFGLIATNTIAQGETRSSGLRWICKNGGGIYAAHRRFQWPGQAAVVVSVVHVLKGLITGPFLLDDRSVPAITAFLFHAGGHDDPVQLRVNENHCFKGTMVYGMGFTFDDDDKNGAATPISEMSRLIQVDKRNALVIFPYIGGEEVNDSPSHSHCRYVINFGEMTEEAARNWPDLFRIVEEKVKPERLKQNREVRKKYWWRFGETTPALFAALKDIGAALVSARHQPNWCLAYVRSTCVFSDALNVFALPTLAAFCALQSRPHELWARFFGSSMKDDLRYTPSNCFATFPFPTNFESDANLEAAGKEYYEFRAALMVKNNEGLTKTYNRFHDPSETSPEIHKLRDLHAAMDAAVLAAYGWTDLQPTCEFLLDYEDEEDEEEGSGARGEGRARQKKKPWRYRWPDDFRDEVLARLLALNKERAEQEQISGATAAANEKKKAGKPGRKKRG